MSQKTVLLGLCILVVSRTRIRFGHKSFATAGPQVWNSLPPNLRLLLSASLYVSKRGAY